MNKAVKYLSDLNWLQIILILVCLHSFMVGVGLIFMPGKLMPFFGLAVPVEKFFQVQGGIFHIVMAIAYFIAALWYDRNKGLILFIILSKFLATVFLFSFYFLVEMAWIILFSGIADCLMGLAILWIYLKFYWDLDFTDWDYSGFNYYTGPVDYE